VNNYAPRISYFGDYLADELVENLRTQQYHVRYLQGLSANRWNIRNVLAAKIWNVVFYFGHGEYDTWRTIFGTLIDERHAEYFANTIVFTYSCKAAATLGEKMVAAGAIAFIGNTQTMYGALPDKAYNFAADFKAIWFTEIADLFAGKTIDQCVSQARKGWEQLSSVYLQKFHETGVELFKSYSEHARDNGLYHIYWGNGNVYLDIM
jgi:hypothetical protein